MFQTKHQDFIFFYLFGKPFPKNSIRKNFLLGITKAPGAGS